MNGHGGYDHPSTTHQENFNPAGGGRYPPHLPDNQVPAVQPPRREREYNWKQSGATECSASCGKGRETQFVLRMYADIQRDLQKNLLISDNMQPNLAFPKINVVT